MTLSVSSQVVLSHGGYEKAKSGYPLSIVGLGAIICARTKQRLKGSSALRNLSSHLKADPEVKVKHTFVSRPEGSKLPRTLSIHLAVDPRWRE